MSLTVNNEMGICKEDLEIRPADMGNGVLLLAGLLSLAVSGFLLVNGTDGGFGSPATGNHAGYSPALIDPPSGSYYSYQWGGVQYKYEWGWGNYATGTFEIIEYANGTYSNGYCVFHNDSTAFVRDTGGCAVINSYNNGSPQIFYNLTDDKIMTLTRTADTVFHASDFFCHNTDNVQVTIDINANQALNPSVSGFVTANSQTVIDWQNILELILTVGGD